MHSKSSFASEAARIAEIREKIGPLSKENITLLRKHPITADQRLQALAEASKAQTLSHHECDHQDHRDL